MKFLQHTAAAAVTVGTMPPPPSSSSSAAAAAADDEPPKLRWARVATTDKDKVGHVCMDPCTRQWCAVFLQQSCVVELWDVGTLPLVMARLTLPAPPAGEYRCVGMAWSWCRGFLCGAFRNSNDDHRVKTLVATWDVARGDPIAFLKYVVSRMFLFFLALPAASFLTPHSACVSLLQAAVHGRVGSMGACHGRGCRPAGRARNVIVRSRRVPAPHLVGCAHGHLRLATR